MWILIVDLDTGEDFYQLALFLNCLMLYKKTGSLACFSFTYK